MASNTVWDQVFSAGKWGRYPGEDLIRFVARNYYGAPDRSKVRILEVGCGPGANLWYLANEGFSIVGLDGSAVALAQARRRLDEAVPAWTRGGELIHADARSIPLPDASVDAAIDSECVYCHRLEDSKRIYREIARVLRPGGKLFVRTFAEGTWGVGTGVEVEQDTWECAEGPAAGKGLLRVTREENIRELLGELEVTYLELITLTYENQTRTQREWIIHATKPRMKKP